MRLLEVKEKYAVNSEDEATAVQEHFRQEAAEKGYKILDSHWTYKTKKSKGEIIAERWVVEIVKQFEELWDEI